MKRNQDLSPEFDEIIFGNRNKMYGAYDLRKRYKSTLSLSIFFGITLSAIIIALLAFSMPTKVIASNPMGSVILTISDPIIQTVEPPAPLKPPAEAIALAHIAPVVTDNPSEVTPDLLTAEQIGNQVENGILIDTIAYLEQPDPVVVSDPEPRIFVEEMPEFPGGDIELLKFVSTNLEYPGEAVNNNIQGRVTIKFAVNADGSVGRIEVIGPVDPLLDNEAIRIINLLPRFKPGKQNGVAVPVWFTIPVVFRIK
jgi:protein TonB